MRSTFMKMALMGAGVGAGMGGDGGRSYYVDATLGNDANAGTQAAPIKTITAVNTLTLHGGDRVLFKRGETFAGVRLTCTSGAKYADYGSGALPIIDGQDTVDCVAVGLGTNGVYIQNLHCTQGLDFGFHILGGYNITIDGVEADNCGNDGIIFITGCHDCTVINSSSHHNYERAVGPLTTGLEISDDCHDISVTNLTSNINEGAGVSIHSHALTGMPYNITLTNVTCDGNRDYGIRVLKQDTTVNADRNIVLTNCSGINQTSTLVVTNAGLNITQNAGCVLQGITANGFISTGNAQRPFYTNAKNITLNRCVFPATSGATSDFDNQFNGAVNANINNSVFYATLTLPVDVRGAATNGVHFKNCIIMRNGSNGDIVENVVTTDVTYDNCLYKPNQAITTGQWRWGASFYTWANWLLNTAQDVHSPTPSDPKFVDQTSPAWDFALQAGSPAIDAGVVIAGVTDGYLGTAPDCGAYEKA